MGVWEYDAGADHFTPDDRAHALFGDLLRPSPTPFARFAALLASEDRARVRSAIERAFASAGELVDAEFRIRLPDGQRILAARGKAVHDGDGHARLMGVLWDVTAARAAEAQARSASERLQLAALGAGIGCWESSVDGDPAVWDEPMYRLFGASAGDGNPRAIEQRSVLPEDWPQIHRARAEALRSGEFAQTYRIRREGQIRWLAARGRTRYDAGGAPASIASVNFDGARCASVTSKAINSSRRNACTRTTSPGW